MIARLAFLGVLLCALPATAQEIAGPPAQAAPAPSTPAEIAAAKAEADRLIATANAGAYFTNVTEGGAPSVRHTASGMICRFEPGQPLNNIRVYPARPEAPVAGEDVSCGTNAVGGAFTVYATRYKPMPSEADDMREAVRQMREAYGEIKSYEGNIGLARTEEFPVGQTLVVDLQYNGRRLISLTQIAHRDDWAFKLRASGPPEAVNQVGIYGSMAFLTMLMARETRAAP